MDHELVNRDELAEALNKVMESYEDHLPDYVLGMGIVSYTRGTTLSRYVFWGKLELVARCIRLSKGRTALDFGCGAGVVLPTLSRYNELVYATDLHLGIARDVIDWIQLDNVQLIEPENLSEIPNGTLDTIVAANVLEHVDELRMTLDEMRKLLRPDGVLIVSGPTEKFLYRLGRRIIGFSGKYHHRDVNSVFDMVVSAGFRIMQLHYYPLSGPLCLYKIAQFAPNS